MIFLSAAGQLVAHVLCHADGNLFGGLIALSIAAAAVDALEGFPGPASFKWAARVVLSASVFAAFGTLLVLPPYFIGHRVSDGQYLTYFLLTMVTLPLAGVTPLSPPRLRRVTLAAAVGLQLLTASFLGAVLPARLLLS